MSDDTQPVDQLEQAKFWASVPWTRIHGGFDFLGEACLATASIYAGAEYGLAALYAAAFLILPDAAHSLIMFFKGDGSQKSAEKARELTATSGYKDPQKIYREGWVGLLGLTLNALRLRELSAEERSTLREAIRFEVKPWTLKGAKRLYDRYPVEVARGGEGCGKIAQVLLGLFSTPINPIGAAAQATAGTLNAAAVAFDAIPETDDKNARGIKAHFSRCGQKYAAGTQLVATASYIPAIHFFGGLTTNHGFYLALAVLFWGCSYGAKALSSKLGYALGH